MKESTAPPIHNSFSRRQFLSSSLTTLSLATFCPPARAVGRPPNVVLILIDDLGWKDLGCCGGEYAETPRIDAFSKDCLRFTQAYANCPVCSPSRAAIMTGKSPARVGFTGHITATGAHRHPEKSRILPPNDNLKLPLEEVTIAEVLKQKGYLSASVGKWHLGPKGFWPEDQGFDVNVGGWTHGSPPSYNYPYEDASKVWNPSIPTLKPGNEGKYLTDRLTDEAINFIEENRSRPFFLYLTHYAVHTPLQPPKELGEKYKKKFAGKDVPMDPAYAAMLENMDANTGRVLGTLRDLKLEENTVVIFTSDNGGLLESASQKPLRAGKGSLYEGGIRVPLMIRWPGRITPGTTDQISLGADLYPTIASVADTPLPANIEIDGCDLSPLWNGGTVTSDQPRIWYYPHYQGEWQRPGAAIRSGKYKLIETYDPVELELYDLAADPYETTNLALEKPQETQVLLGELRSYLDRVCKVRHTANPDHEG